MEPRPRASMGRPKLSQAALRRHQVTLSLRDEELNELRRRAGLARLSIPDYLRQRAVGDRLRLTPARRLGAEEFRAVSKLAVNVNQMARAMNQGRTLPAAAAAELARLRSLLARLLPAGVGLVVCKVHKSGSSFRGAVSYCLSEKRERLERPQDLDEHPASPESRAYEAVVAERSRWAEEVPRPAAAARVAWTETINLATDDPRVAAPQMAATVDYAGELKRLSGVGAGGRKLEKPVLHYTLSWDEGETPQRPAMVDAVRSSFKALGIADRQAVVVAHGDGTTPHVHVIANRVSGEDGRAAPLSQSKLKLSRWAEAHERQQGRIRYEQRVENNRLRRAGRRAASLKQPLYRRRAMPATAARARLRGSKSRTVGR